MFDEVKDYIQYLMHSNRSLTFIKTVFVFYLSITNILVEILVGKELGYNKQK